MRGSQLILIAPTVVLFGIAVAWPGLAGIEALANASGDYQSQHSMGDILFTTASWSLVVTIGVLILGWLPGRWLGACAGRRSFSILAAALLMAICLPAYVVFYSWWQTWPPGSAVFEWAATDADRQLLLKNATLFLGLAGWSWPLVSWCVALSAMQRPVQRDDMLSLDGAGWLTRMLDHLRTDMRGLMLGGLLVFLVTFNNTTCFDLAGIFSVGNELRAAVSQGASARVVLNIAVPSLIVVGIGALITWFMFIGVEHGHAIKVRPATRATRITSSMIWFLAVILPLILFVVNIGDLRLIGSFLKTYDRGLVNTIGLAGIIGCLISLIAIGQARMWQDHRRSLRVIAHVMAILWLISALLPAHVVGVALNEAYNRPVMIYGEKSISDLVYASPMMLALAHLARFGFIGVLIGRWVARRESHTLGNLRRLDGATGAVGYILAVGPRLIVAAVSAMLIGIVFSMGEIALTARFQPPGFEALAQSLLNEMHYQRPQFVIAAIFVLLGTAVAVSIIVAAVIWLTRPRIRNSTLSMLLLLSICLVGCSASTDNEVPNNLPVELTFGAPGRGFGQFNYPRGIAVDAQREFVYVVDKTARIQRFDLDGTPQTFWQMPEYQSGKPTGLNIAPDGRVFVADTHYYRVIAFDSEGNELMRFGSYGTEPGQFIYPTDIEFGADGRLYVSEYGSNDRVQIFSAEGEYISSFGSFGEEIGQFNRPQSMAFSLDRTELYIADACNHRIVVVDTEGKVKRILCDLGREPGQLMYPYDVTVLNDGSLMICEFGNGRVQRIDHQDGRSLGVFGQPGRSRGQLQFPWGVDDSDDQVYILDSGNNRVQVMENPG